MPFNYSEIYIYIFMHSQWVDYVKIWKWIPLCVCFFYHCSVCFFAHTMNGFLCEIHIRVEDISKLHIGSIVKSTIWLAYDLIRSTSNHTTDLKWVDRNVWVKKSRLVFRLFREKKTLVSTECCGWFYFPSLIPWSLWEFGRNESENGKFRSIAILCAGNADVDSTD